MKQHPFRSRLPAMAMSLLLAVSMAACGPDTAPTQPGAPTTLPAETTVPEAAVPGTTVPGTTVPGTSAPETTVPGPFNEGLDELRRRMEPSAAVAGVFYLGYTEKTPEAPGFFQDLENQAALLENPFILEIPRNRFVKQDGGHVFCIVPADPSCQVCVTAWNGDTNQAGDALYTSSSGDPILLQGNSSDLMPNLSVSFGCEGQTFQPFLSMRDGSVALPEEPLIMDFTDHPAPPALQDEDSLSILRSFLEPTDAIACIMYLGSTDLTFEDPDFWESLGNRDLLANNPFLREIPPEHRLKQDGMEVFCLIPTDPDSTVTVYDWDMGNGIPGEALFTCRGGEPVLLQGNSSGSIPNLCVSVTDSAGRVLEYYQPHISMRDGSVFLPEEPPVLDYGTLIAK